MNADKIQYTVKKNLFKGAQHKHRSVCASDQFDTPKTYIKQKYVHEILMPPLMQNVYIFQKLKMNF